jgi:hypothetical protein
MITIEKTVDISADRRFHLDFTLPQTVPSGKTSVVLMFPAEPPASGEEASFSDELEHLIIEELKADGRRKAEERLAEMERTGVDPLQKYCGALKDIFPEDGLDYQRKMRDEWLD